MSDIRKEIKTVDPKDPNILSSPEEKKLDLSEEILENTEEAIDDTVIDGSPSIEEINKETEEILESAIKEAKSIKKKAREEGYDTGYIEGQKAFQVVIDNGLEDLKEKEAELEIEKENYLKILEIKVADIIQKLLVNMVGVYKTDPALILYLVRLAFEETHTYSSFIIKVSDEDFDYLVENKIELTKDLSSKVEIEILKDKTMKKSQCFVETEMGNIDCSLDLRLESLSRELKLIGDSLKSAEAVRGEGHEFKSV